MPNKIISVRNLNFSYPDGKKVLHDVSFDIFKGQAVGLIGPNGAGKTTLLLHLNGTLKGEGEIIVNEKRVSRENIYQIRKEVAIVFQDPETQLFMPTVYDDVAFGPLNMNYSKAVIEKKVDEALDKIEMLHLKNSLTHHLSMGEKRKVSLAATLVMEPDVLVLDEPSGNLDPYSRRNLMKLLGSFDITTIIASHDLDLIYQLCQRCILISGGRIVAEGETRDILMNEALLEENRLEVPLAIRARKM